MQLVQRLEPDVFDAHVAIRLLECPLSEQGRRDLLGTADEERVPGLGEEAPVGEDNLRTRESVVSFRNTLTSWVSSRSHARSDTGDSNVRPSTSVSPKYIRPSIGSWSASRSPRSSIERKNAVERARGALHSANTGIGATYP